MKRLLIISTAAALLVALLAPSAQAAFGLQDPDVTYTEADGSTTTQAGAHPFRQTTSFSLNTLEDEVLKVQLPDEDLRDFTVTFPPGIVIDRNATPTCKLADFIPEGGGGPKCPPASTVGVTEAEVFGEGAFNRVQVYNLPAPRGVVARIGFSVSDVVPALIELGLEQEPPYRGFARLRGIPQILPLYSSKVEIWGTPAAKAHDAEREGPGDVERPFLTMPRSCTGPMQSVFDVTSWSGSSFLETIVNHGEAGEALGMSGCGKLAFEPSITAAPTTKAAQSPTGLDFSLDVADEGISNPTGIAQSEIRKTVVTLPEGFSTNPSLAEGLEVCSEADLERETIEAPVGVGCPQASKIGTVELESPLIEGELLSGSLFIAEPYANPFDSLIAMYLVIKDPELGILVKQPLKVIPDPVTGQLRTIAEEMPQLPFSHFRLHFREGTRSPLASPPGCGTYAVKAELYPWAGGPPVSTTSAFEIITGPESKPCPSGGLPPFKPGLIAGTLNNAAGRFSPFNVRLFRTDSEQEFTHFSIKLPPGIVGILAGIPYCSEAAIAQAISRTGPHGGAEELADPSCPAASEIGHTLAGGGVGPSLAYAPGKVYLAGPYKGTAFSLVAINAATVGPFDLGTVVVRQGFKVDRETAEVFIDATESDPIPHIIEGVPVHLRDIRAYVDRSKFVFNPTNCERTSTASTLLGAGLDFGSAHDDRPVTVSTPFQAADCAALKFKPKLGLTLRGGTKRGAHPALRAVLKMNGGPERGEANVARAQVTLPRSAFLEQGHIKTICTRVQFRSDQCPAGSIYGYARAFTPVLDTPVQGPVYLRSSEHQLPDLVASLHSEKITVDVVGRIDSLKGRIRNTFEAVPDAPVTKFVLTMQGGKKGLIVNSTNLCKGTQRAISDFTAQNGKVFNTRPVVKAKCGKSGKAGKAKKRRAG